MIIKGIYFALEMKECEHMFFKMWEGDMVGVGKRGREKIMFLCFNLKVMLSNLHNKIFYHATIKVIFERMPNS